jgi:hypothetical protein
MISIFIKLPNLKRSKIGGFPRRKVTNNYRSYPPRKKKRIAKRSLKKKKASNPGGPLRKKGCLAGRQVVVPLLK